MTQTPNCTIKLKNVILAKAGIQHNPESSKNIIMRTNRLIIPFFTLTLLLFFLPALFRSFADTCQISLARIKYGGGGDWYSDPTSLPNLIKAIQTRTKIPVCPEEKRIELTDPDLYGFPLLYITGHGNIRFTDEEVSHLRSFLLSGGFLHADDNYGMDKSFRREMNRVFPELDWVEVPFSHPIYHCFYPFPEGLPKIHKHKGGAPKGLGLFHNGSLIVFYSFNTDLGDGWEDMEVHKDPPELHEKALRMGINIITYALSEK